MSINKEYKFHEAADIFPLDEEHLDELAEDIKKHGQQVAIELLGDLILDGRRRYLACLRVGIVPRFIEVDITDPIIYVQSLNLHRRHLTPSQRSMCAGRALKLTEKYSSEAKERQRLSGGRGIKGVANFPHLNEDQGKTRDKIGEQFGVSGRSVDSATKVLRKGTPALQKAVDTKLIAISTAEKVSFLPEEEQNKMVERAKQATAEGRKSGIRSEIDNKQVASDRNNKLDKDLKGMGVIYAHEAINCLKRIPIDDQLRKRGFQIVTDWIKHNK